MWKMLRDNTVNKMFLLSKTFWLWLPWLSHWHPAVNVTCFIGKYILSNHWVCLAALILSQSCWWLVRLQTHASSPEYLLFIFLSGGKWAHGPWLPAGLQGRSALLWCHCMHWFLCPRPQGHTQHAQWEHCGMYAASSHFCCSPGLLRVLKCYLRVHLHKGFEVISKLTACCHSSMPMLFAYICYCLQRTWVHLTAEEIKKGMGVILPAKYLHSVKTLSPLERPGQGADKLFLGEGWC